MVHRSYNLLEKENEIDYITELIALHLLIGFRLQIYPHKAKINANIASIYAIINPKKCF